MATVETVEPMYSSKFSEFLKCESIEYPDTLILTSHDGEELTVIKYNAEDHYESGDKQSGGKPQTE